MLQNEYKPAQTSKLASIAKLCSDWAPEHHRQDRVALIFIKFRGIVHKENIRNILPNRRSAILDLRMQWLTHLTFNHGVKHPVFINGEGSSTPRW